MSAADVVIVGAGPAGLSCAESYRDRGGSGSVVLVGRDPDPPYERPPLSKDYLRGESGREELAMRDPDFYREREITLETETEVTALDPDARTVTLVDGRSLEYKSCVLATGSRPMLPELPGVDHPAVRTLREIAHSDALRDGATEGAEVLIVGSGFIGCEAAVSLAALGATVTMATDEDQPQQVRLGADVARRLTGWIEEAGVRLLSGSELTGIEGGDRPRAAVGDEAVEADLVLLALGARRNTELAEAAGIELIDGLISTDEHMRTTCEGVLAVGDIARALNPTAGRPLAVEHWGEAINHGEVAGAVLAGEAEAGWRTAPGFWSTIGERTLKQVAWGDGYDEAHFEEGPGEAFTARYLRDGVLVGVVTHDADDDHERGRELVESGAEWSPNG